MHILYIEDNQNDVDLTQRYLARHAPEIRMDHARTCGDGLAMLARCSQERPVYDVVLTDMRLPDGDGLKVLAYVRSQALPIPVIVLTGTGSEEVAVAALKGGAEDYIAKRQDYLARLPNLLVNTLTRFRAAASRYSRPVRVLYAEHHSADIDLTRRHLARYAPHIQLEIVKTSQEVLSLLASDASASHYDVLMLDYRLPGMNALDIIKELEYRDAPKLPVVLVTGQGDEEVAVQALRLGIADYLVKNPGYLFQLPRMIENTYTQTLLQRERAALYESEQRYRSLFDLAPVAIVTKDLSGIYTSSNTFATEVLGRDPSGLTDAELLDADVAARLMANDRAVMESGIEQIVEERLVTEAGERFFFSRKSPLRDRRGHVNGMMGIGLEITDRIRAEEAQKENQRRLAQLVEHVDEVIWLSETQGRKLLYISPAYEQVWGRSVASAYADPDSMIAAIIPDDEAMAQSFVQAMTDGEDRHLEFRIKRADGAIAWITAQTSPVRDEQGHIYRVAGLARDITEHRRNEEYLQQQERLAAVGQMAAGIAHDFNNILAIITLYTQMLQITTQQAAHQRHLTTIYQQATHAANLVQQILDFSRRSTLERVTMDIVPFVKELVRLWQRTLPESIRVELEMGSEALVISADPSRLQQALMNMAINARDAMPEGGILRLSVAPVDFMPGQQPPHVASFNTSAHRKHNDNKPRNSDHWLCIGISDSGSGIPSEVLPHIFDPFFTTKGPGLGTGLGLSQVHGIVHQLDGMIQVESQVGAGTLFTIYLPLVNEVAAAGDDDFLSLPRGQGETILLVEDEAALREAMAEMLIELGYQVLSAENGRRAIYLFHENKPQIDIVVSDLVMPDMGGKELYQALVKEYGSEGLLRMLLVTGYPQESLQQWQTTNSIVRWLQKPFAMEIFAQRVAETLRAGHD